MPVEIDKFKFIIIHRRYNNPTHNEIHKFADGISEEFI